jgi:hypothetical protein
MSKHKRKITALGILLHLMTLYIVWLTTIHAQLLMYQGKKRR